MKNFLIILAIIFPIALSGQSNTTENATTKKKNTITASTYLGPTSGLALDLRRGFNKNRELILGMNTTYNGVRTLNFGFRKYYKTSNKLSLGFGVDVGLKKRNVIGDNLVSRAIENTFLKINYGQLRFVSGAYYKIDDRFDLMGEVQLKPLSPIWRRGNKNIKVGLMYKF